MVARHRARIPLRTPDLLEHLVRQMGPTFRPKEIHVVAELPKTQSGKIVRRLIRQKYLGEKLDETSTLGESRVAGVHPGTRGLSGQRAFKTPRIPPLQHGD